MKPKTLWRLLLLPILLFLVYSFGWEAGERVVPSETFIYENF